MLKALPLLALLACAPALTAQAPSAIASSPTPPAVSSAPGDEWTHADLVSLGHELLKKAEASSNGSYSVYLIKYDNHFTMLASRVKSGAGEYHGKWTDFFVCVEGEATVIVGGTLENEKDKDNGEKAGTRVIGGTSHVMRPGDVVHIAAGTPHQTTVAPGQHVVYYVVKVAQ